MQKYSHILIILLLFFFVNKGFTQLSHGGIPKSLQSRNPYAISTLELQVPAKELLKEEKQSTSGFHYKSLKFAVDIPVNIDPSNYGTWYKIDSHAYMWLARIQSQHAYSLGLVFENYKLKPSEKLFVYSKSEVLGAFTDDYNRESGIFATQQLAGNEAIIEFTTSDTLSHGTFVLKKVFHAFRDLLVEPGACNVNINCPEGDDWQIEKRAVVKVRINGKWCTGSLLNNTAKDGKSYLLTANHCVETNEEGAEAAVFYFNYESPSCENSSISINQVLTGSRIASTLYENEYSLLELYQRPPMSFKPYYAGWSTDTSQNLIGTTGIHHPQGGIKKISKFYDTVKTTSFLDYAPKSFWLIKKWDLGVTEEGSSGSALFDNQHHIIGTLTGGEAVCGNPINDYYEKFANSYYTKPIMGDSLRRLLDPLNAGATTLDGYDPFAFKFGSCDTISNLIDSEKVAAIPYDFGLGYYGGQNEDSITTYAEKFENSNDIYIYGASVHLDKCGKNGGLIFFVMDGDDKPQNILYERYVSEASLKNHTDNFIEFYPNITVKSNYFIGFTVSYNEADTVIVSMALPRNSQLNSSYLKRNNSWEPYNIYTIGSWGSSFDIRSMTCNVHDTEVIQPVSFSKVEIFPNPADDYVNIRLDANADRLKQITAIDLSGKKIILPYQFFAKRYLLNLTSLKRGFYLIQLVSAKNIATVKLIKN